MKLQADRVHSVIAIVILGKVPTAIVLFLFIFIPSLLFLSGTYAVLLAAVVVLVYFAYYAIDTYLFATTSSIAIEDNMLFMSSKGLVSRTNVALPISQINSLNIVQPFILRLFNVAKLSVSVENGNSTSIWGFSYEVLDKFVKEFNKKYHIKFSNLNSKS